MRRYQVEFAPAAYRQFLDSPAREQRRIGDRIDALQSDPRPRGCVKLEWAEDIYRVRAGDYRIVYQVRDRVLQVLVLKVGNRRDVYRKR